MSTNTPPFEVICVMASGTGDADYILVVGEKYIVENIMTDPMPFSDVPGDFYQLREAGELNYYHHSHFRRIPPYQNSVSKELAEQAMETVKDNQDVKPVRKEVEV